MDSPLMQPNLRASAEYIYHEYDSCKQDVYNVLHWHNMIEKQDL